MNGDLYIKMTISTGEITEEIEEYVFNTEITREKVIEYVEFMQSGHLGRAAQNLENRANGRTSHQDT